MKVGRSQLLPVIGGQQADARFSNKHQGMFVYLGIGKETLFLIEASIHHIKQQDEPEERRL